RNVNAVRTAYSVWAVYCPGFYFYYFTAGTTHLPWQSSRTQESSVKLGVQIHFSQDLNFCSQETDEISNSVANAAIME
uniref:Uncharacterized protein n=1 Tax=Coturnix japonica TaxID=93934 RepID=A0A8C2YBW8_COTJA